MVCNSENGRDIIVIGSGRTISDYRAEILDFVYDNKIVSLGINNMTSLFSPKYHLWTNTKQFSNFKQCISSSSTLLLGEKLSGRAGEKHTHKVVKTVESEKVLIDGEIIYGKYRTAGVLGIMVANLMGAKNIYVVGMDGFTLYGKDELKNKSRSQHCYGSGYTDDADWEKCLDKDRQVQENLTAIKKAGVDFSILTPTKFKDFYLPGVVS